MLETASSRVPQDATTERGISPMLIAWRLSLGIAPWVAAAVIAGTTVGCTTSPAGWNETGSAVLRPSAVAPGTQLACAERAAAVHEGDFAVCGSGQSMAPYYSSGTALVVHPTSYFMLRRGMVVVYRTRHGRQIAHVLIEPTLRGWVAAGLNNREADDDMVTAANLVGVVRCAFTASGRQIAAISPVSGLNRTE